MTNVPSDVLEKAKAEIREDEIRKLQSLEQLRDFVSKHPFISSCRTGKLVFFSNGTGYLCENFFWS